MEEIKAWKTTDGKMYTEKSFALKKQAFLDNRSWFRKNILRSMYVNSYCRSSHDKAHYMGDDFSEDLFNWIIENKEDIIEMIKKSN